MKSIRQFLNGLFASVRPLPAGMYHSTAAENAPSPYRLHLRLEPNGDGLLIVNASTVVHLNQTAAEYAYHLVQNTPEPALCEQISRRYRVKKEQALADFRALSAQIQSLATMVDVDPETFLGPGHESPYSGALSAPYRLDCALTYRNPDEEAGPVAPHERVRRELLASEWESILNKAWIAGIPHIVFTGGEPTIYPELPNLIAYAESLGQVTGLLTNGLRLAEPEYLHLLLQNGLDHILFVFDPQEDQCWEAARDVLGEDIAVTFHLTLTTRNIDALPEVLSRLSEMGAKTLSLSADTERLAVELQNVRQTASSLGFQLVWDLPVPYSRFHPVAFELSGTPEEPDGSGKAWLYVEPDGDVLPAQGIQRTLGNLLSDSWDVIWKNARS